MLAAKLNVRPASLPGAVVPDETTLVIPFAQKPMPASSRRLVCHWHRSGDGRLACTWAPDIAPHPLAGKRLHLVKPS